MTTDDQFDPQAPTQGAIELTKVASCVAYDLKTEVQFSLSEDTVIIPDTGVLTISFGNKALLDIKVAGNVVDTNGERRGRTWTIGHTDNPIEELKNLPAFVAQLAIAFMEQTD